MTEGKIVHTLHELMLSYTNALDLGFEGVMVKDLNSPYVFDRTPAVKKLKPCDDTEGLIVGFYDAGVGTKREGMFGGFEVMFRNGIITNVGGGLSDNLKAQIQLEGPNSYVGKFVTIEYQPDPFTSDGFTEDGKARFPVFIRFRDVTDIDPQLVSECLLHSGLSSI
jgi:DNA ligase-1